jgi:hypothetical protein
MKGIPKPSPFFRKMMALDPHCDEYVELDDRLGDELRLSKS